MASELVGAVLVVSGAGLIVAGVAQIYWPASLIVGGLFAGAASVAWLRGGAP